MENSERFARLWEQLIVRNELNVCEGRLAGTNLLDVNVLRIIKGTEGIRVKEIIQKLKASNSTISSAIKRLESRGLVERKISQEDLRSFCIVLTEEGRLAMEEHFEKEKDVTSYLLEGLETKEDQDTFLNLLDQIVGHVNKNA